MSKNKNSLSVLCYNKKNTHTTVPFGFRWAPFLIFQLFIALLVVQPNAWAGLDTWEGLDPESLFVDANGDSVFNGDQEKLTIKFKTDDIGDENRTYTYKIFVNGRTTPIFSGPREGDTLSGKQTVQVEWDGKLEGETNRLPDGDYTIKVVLNIVNNGEAAVQDEKLEQTAKVTLDTKTPEISISVDNMEFSPTSEKKGFPVYYGGLDEDVAEAWLEFQRDTGGDPVKRAIEPNELSKEGGIYYWDGKDNNSKPFFDGQYTLQLWVKDRGGNVAGSNKIATITIDSADNAAPTLESVATDKGKFITPGSGISGEMSFVEATLEDNIELNLDDSTIRLIGPSGSPVLGQQTRPADNKIRWQLLSPLLAKDGLQDGQYTVEIVGADKAGNKTTPILITFLFDNLAPELVSLKPTRDGEAFNILGDTVYYNLPLNQFVTTFNDGESGTGVALLGGQEPTRIVFGTPNPDDSITRISGRAFPDQNNDVLTYILNAPLLKTDGSQDGDYSLNVRATDSLGNTKTYTYRIIYDTQVPALGTTVPAANQTVSNLSEVVVKLNEVTSGIDFVQSTFRLNRGIGENQVEVPVNISSNGADTATLSLLQPIALDGSDDGTYTIEVIPTDLAGNIGAVVRRQFYLVSRTQPQVKLTAPSTGTVNSLDSVTVEIDNYIGSGINFDASTITVRNAQGLLVPQAEIESDATNNQLTWSTEATIPRNGTADGRYTITATFVDFSGKRFTQSFPIVLDTQFPSVNSVEVITDPQVQLSLNSATDIPETFSQITVTFDESDIDFENTVVSLTGPGETDIALHRSHDGDTLLTLNFQNLAQLGTYTFTLTPIDRIGNVSETPFIYRFRLDIAVPVVTTVLIGGQSGPVVYVNGSASEIVATLVDTIGAGIAIGNGESTIVVMTEVGLPVPGITTTNDENQLIWQPTALPTDGSADGRYTVAITPVDKVGRTGDVAYRSFILDTQAPRISAATPITLHQPISYIGESLTQFQFTAEDVGPALLDLDDQTIVLNKTSGEAVAGQITHDGNNQLFFTLFAPLPTDGSADGEYVLTVDLVDKAGNPYQLKHNLFYDSQAPRLSAVSLNTETPLSLTPYQVTDLSESISKLTLNFVESTRVDFTETMIVLAGPDGSAIPLTLENNGIDQIVVSFVSLTQGGLYTLSVTPQDIAGNVAQGAVPYPFRLEFEVPGLASVKANSVAASVGLVQHEIIDISESVSSFTLAFTDAIRVDFENTGVVLVGPSGQEIPVTLEDNDGSQLMVRFVSLTQSGLYTLSVTPQDIAGNVAQSAMRYQFRLDIALPTVSSILIDGELGTNVYANTANINVVVTLFDPTGVGLALGNEGSTIVVSNAEGLVVSGIITSNGTNELIWTPSALPVDGSADGRYTVTITPLDKSGRSGTIVNRHFILDTQAPRITASTPVTLYQPVSYIGDSLSHFQFTVEDAGPSLLDLDDQTIGFKKKSGEVVSGQITNDGSNQLFFTLSAPLPTDGSADGEYVLTVDLVDKAGNPYQIEHNISYDSQAPQLSAVSLNTETPLNLIPYEVTDLSESISKLTLNFVESTRVDFTETMIVLAGPDGSAIPLTLENNGIDQIVVSFVSLTQGGIYTLSVTPQDIAGNVAQGAVPYPFRLEFVVPGLASVKANSVAASVGLVQHEIIDISESVSSFTFAFTDAMRVDFENTGVVLVGPSGQEIPVTLEDNDGSQLMVRFVSLTQSGLYTLSVTPQDIAGNVAQSAMRYQFRLDIALPTVSSVLIDGKLGTNVYVNTANINVVVTLFDPTGVGLALGDEGSTIVVTNAEGLVVSGIITSNGTNELTWTPTVLPTDGSADGRYTVTITPIDKSGRSGTIVNRHFILDTQAPHITASTPVTLYQPVSYIGDSLSHFQFTVEDAGPSLLDLDDQTIGFKKKSGEVVSGQITNDGSNQLFFTLSAPLPTDGSADGEYVLTVDLVDKAGNPYQIEHNISYDSQAPRLSAVSLNTETPLNLTPYQVTDLSESINKLTLNFVESTRVDFAETVITLMSPDGSAVPLTLENNGIDQIVASFVSLTQGGLYTLSVTPQDIAGNVAQGAVPYPFRLKFVVPGLASVKANSVAASVGLVQHEIIDISESISSLTLAFTDAIRVDFKNTGVVLVGPSGQEIPVTLEDNDDSQLMVRFVSLTQGGIYTLSVTPQDIAGNVAQSAVRYQFRLDIALPTVSSVLIDGKLGTNVYANNANINVVVTLFDPTGVGLALGNEGSTIVVSNAEGLVVSGIITSNGTNELTWTPTVLPTDGSADGRYTVTITPIDKSGRSGTIVNRHFILDTQAPRITASTPVTLYQPVSYIGDSLSYFQFTVEDAGPSLLDLDDQTIGFKKKSGEVVSGQITNDGSNQLFFTLSAPLPTDGSADGEYVLTVDLVDKAGNPYQIEHNISYDSQAPRLSAVSLNTETPLNLTPYQVTDLSESINKLTLNFVESTRVDFSETVITLMSPDGSAVSLTLENNGIDEITVSFVTLTQGGIYTLSVTPQDIAGNVAQGAVPYPFRLKLAVPGLASVKANTADASLELTSYEITDITESISSLTLAFTDAARVDLENTRVTLTSEDGQEIPATLEDDGNSQLVVRFISLTQSGLYTLSVTPQDIAGNVAQGAVPYPFRLEFVIPGLASVKANSVVASVGLVQHEIIDISESISSLTLAFTDAIRVDFENTGVVLVGPSGQEIPVTLEDNDGSQLMVRFVSLTQSGLYTLSVTPQDIAGNVAQSAMRYQFRLDIALPTVSSVLIDGKLGTNVYVNTANINVVVTLFDPTGVGLALGDEGSTIVVTNAEGLVVSGIITSNGTNELTWTPTVLPTDGSADGRYTVTITPIDKSGRSGTIVNRHFILDTQAPRITASTPVTLYQPVSYIGDSLSYFQFTVEDAGPSLLDLDDQTIGFKKKSGEVVSGQITNDGSNQLFFTLSAPLPTDGSADGEYVLTVDLVDKAGNPYQLKHNLFYDSQVPRLSAVSLNTETPLNLTPYQVTDLSESINKLTLNFVESTRVDFTETAIVLAGPDGSAIPLTLENNGIDQIVASFVSLTQGGLYTLSVTPQDIAGNVAQGAVPYPFRLKFVVPGLASVKANSVAASVGLVQHEIIDISESVSSLTLAFTDAIRVDFKNTGVVLVGPSGQEIPVTLEDNDDSQLMVRFVSLTQGGIYTLSVTPQDIAGNVAQSAVRYQFRLDIALPTVSSVLIDGKLGTNVYANNANINVVVTLFDPTGVGLALGNEGSTIVVSNAEGLVVSGIITSNGTNELTWTPTVLPTDGSADGRYTVTITPIDKSGRSGTIVNRHFILDTQAPRITASTPVTLYQPVSYIGDSLSYFQFTVEDAGPSLLDLDDQTIGFKKKSGEVVSGQITNDGSNQLFFTLSAPLPTDGSADGEYVLTVDLVDKAGNPYQLKHNLFYDSQVPRLSAVSLNTETPLNLTPYQVTDLSESINKLTLNFVESTRVDFTETAIVLAGPDGSAIPLTLENNGIDQIVASFVSLTQGGLYTLSVTPQDIAGNVAQGAVPYPFRLEFVVPGLASVKANSVAASVGLVQHEIIDISESVSSFTFEFTDAMRVDFENTGVVLVGPSGQEIPVTLEDNDGSQLMVRFVSLTQSGLYTLSVTPQDIAGNVAQSAMRYQFRLDIALPTVSSVLIDGKLGTNVYANTANINVVVTLFDPTGVGLALGDEGSTIVVTNAEGLVVSGIITSNGTNELTWTPTVLSVDGSADGRYTVTITPLDKSGRSGTIVNRHFILDTQAPRITASTPVTLYQPVSYIGDSLSYFQFTVEDAGPSLLDLDDQTIGFKKKSGEVVSGQITNDGSNQLFFTLSAPLPTDGSADGEYVLTVDLVDKAGNPYQIEHNISYDSQAPRLSAVSLNTETPLNLTPYQVTDLSESINKLTLNFVESTRVDFSETVIVLAGPDGSAIPLTLENNGIDQIVVSFVFLTQGGLYTLSVTPQDIAGNAAQGAVPYPFRLKFTVPGLASVKANTAKASFELTSYEITDLSASISSLTLAFTDAVRVDLENTRVTLTGEDGQEIPVTLEDDGNSQLVVRFVSLTQSGLYTLSVTPQDIAGNVAQSAVPYPFRLKFTVPGLASVKANTAKASLELIQHEITEIPETLSSFTLVFTDGMDVDFENTRVTLTGPDAQEIPVSLEENDDSQLEVRFVSLMQSGLYTLAVTPEDKAGNVAQSTIRYQFRLDIALPTVGAILIDGKPGSSVYVSRSIPKIVATIIDSIGVGVSFGDNGTTIVVTNDQGIQMPGTTTSNGTNQLTWTPTPLPTDGSADGQYTVAITPVDKAGRSGTVVNRQFIYDTQAPRITDATPVTLHAPVSYLGGGLNEFVVTIEDVGPADLLLVSQVVALMDAAGKPVPAALTHDALTNQLYLTLSKPFASDGSVDGAYTLNVLLIDKAGNSLISRFAVVYDSQVPQVSSVEVNTAGAPMELVTNQVSELSESIDTITIKFNEATRIDFANTSVSLIDPDDQTIPITQGDDGVSQLTLSFASLTQIGQYTLSVTPQDIAGNAAQSPIQFQFNLQFILPDVESIIIGDTVTLGSADTAYVNADNLLIVANLLDPAGTGLSFDTLTGSDILVATLDDMIVPGTTSTNGTNLIAWRPLTLSDDGSSDGRYAVYVTPVDKKGREGSTIYREFVYDTQKPEITAADPIDLSQPVSYISESLTQLQFTLQDVGPADITLADQKVALRNQNGVVIPTKLTNDSNNQIYLTLNEPLPLDGSRDGEYTVDISFTDKADNVLDVEHPIVYDTQAPTLVSTVPDHGAQLTEDVTQIQVNLDDKGASGIDWTLTTVTLVNPDGVEISGELTSNGKSQLTLNTNQLVADGKYIIRVQAIDRAGNGSESVFERSFLLSRRLPAIISTLPSTAPQDEAFTNKKVEQVEVMLETVDERHLSTLRLLNAASQVVAGQQHRESGKLIYRLVRPLATDGSEDGLYTIEFMPISSSGRSGEIQELVFAYDTQSPELEPETIQLIVTEPEVNNSLTEIRLPLTDNQAGIDWENLDEEWLTFERLSPNATKIAGRVSFDEQDNLIFRLTVPLADNGSADGEYKISVTPTDKAGNGDETYEKVFIYDTSPPVIDPNSLLINDAPLLTDIDAEDYPSAISTSGGVVIQASVTDTGLGVDLSQSRIVVRNPNGAEISGSTQQNGVDTLVFKSDGLNIEGVYQVLITGIGNDSELLGFAPKGSITTEFLYETTAPTAVVTGDGGKTELTDEPLPLEGTAADPQGTRRAGPQGEGEIPVPASGVWLVEIVGTGPDGQPIEPVPAEDESDAQEEPWSRWSVDFLPTRSGEYDIDIRVTDKAGNYAVYDYGKVTMSVSFSFKGNTFGWPNPLRHSKEDVAFFSFDLNASADEKADLTLYIYDWGGDMVYSQKYTDITPGERNDTQIKWNLENQAGTPVARGIYVFRLEAVNGAGNRANAVGKILVVD